MRRLLLASVGLLLSLSFLLFCLPFLIPSLFVQPQAGKTAASEAAYSVAIYWWVRMPWGTDLGNIMAAEGFTLAALALLLVAIGVRVLRPLLQSEVNLPRKLRWLALPITGAGLFFFTFFAAAEFIGGAYYPPQAVLPRYPLMYALFEWLKSSLRGYDWVGVCGFISLLAATLAFIVFRSKQRIGMVFRDGLLLFTTSVALFELGILQFVWTQMGNHVTYFANWGVTDFAIPVYEYFYFASNWAVFTFCWSVTIYGVLNLLLSRGNHATNDGSSDRRQGGQELLSDAHQQSGDTEVRSHNRRLPEFRALTPA